MKWLRQLAGQYRFTRTGISLGQKWLLALPGPAMSLSSVLIHNVYIKLYTDVIGLDVMYVGQIYFWFNLWNMLNDPVFGVLIDRKKYTPGRGKYLYLMRVSVPFILLSLALMLFSSADWPQRIIFLVLLAELFVFDTAFTLFGIANNCYQLIAAPTKEERVDVDVLRGFISNGTSFFATIVPTLLLVGNSQKNRPLITIILMGVIALNAGLYILSTAKLKERPEMYAHGSMEDNSIRFDGIWRDAKSILTMRAFWTWFLHGLLTFGPMGIYFTSYLYYMDHVIRASGFEATVADTGSMLLVLAVLPIIGTQVKRIGGKHAILLSLIPYMLGLGVLFVAVNWMQVTLAYILIQLGRYNRLHGRRAVGSRHHRRQRAANGHPQDRPVRRCQRLAARAGRGAADDPVYGHSQGDRLSGGCVHAIRRGGHGHSHRRGHRADGLLPGRHPATGSVPLRQGNRSRVVPLQCRTATGPGFRGSTLGASHIGSRRVTHVPSALCEGRISHISCRPHTTCPARRT